MPPRRTARAERSTTRRPVKSRRAVEDEEFFDDQEPEDQAPEDEAPEDEVPEDEVPEDEVPEDEVPEDEAPEDEAPEDEETEPEPEDDGADRARARGRGNGQSPGRVTAADAAQNGVRSLVDLIGKQPEGVTAVEPTEDGWLVGVEVIEDQRVPSSADILAVYEAQLDPDGALISYRRTARYARGKGDMSGSSLDDQ
jgi:gas vesicle protein GvpO